MDYAHVHTWNFVLERLVVLRDIAEDHQLVRHFHGHHFTGRYLGRHAQMFFSNVKRLTETNTMNDSDICLLFLYLFRLDRGKGKPERLLTEPNFPI